jgi:uncharacterized protein
MKYTIIMSEKCNMCCRYCFEKDKGAQNLEIETADKTVDFIRKNQQDKNLKPQDIAVNFNGGEALLNFDTIRYMLPKLISLGINDFSLSTNLTLANDEILVYCHSNDIRLHISLDGIKEIHNANRVYGDGKGSFDDVIKNIRFIRKRYPAWNNSYNITLMPAAVPYYYQSFKLLVDLGVRFISTAVCVDENWDEKTLEAFDKNMSRITKDYIKFYEQGEPMCFVLIDTSILTLLRNQVTTCGACDNDLAVLPNGEILACNVFLGTDYYKDYVVSTLDDYLKGGAIKNCFDCSKIDLSECEGCELINKCHHTCYATNRRNTGDVYRIADGICQSNQVILKYAGKVIDHLYGSKNPLFLKQYDQFLSGK